MAWDELSEEEREAVLRAVKAAVAGDPFPLSPRLRPLRAALAKLDPDSVPKPVELPAMPVRPYRPSTLARRKRR